MRKLLTVLLVLVMVVALVACGSKAPEGAVTTLSSDGDVLYLVTEKDGSVVVSENGWHPTLGDGKTAFTFTRVGEKSYALVDAATGMAIDVYENKTGEVGALVAMYTLEKTSVGEQWEVVYNENGTFSFKTIDGLFLSYAKGAENMELSENAMEFYLVKAE